MLTRALCVFLMLLAASVYAEPSSDATATPEAPNYYLSRFQTTGGGVMNVGDGSYRISLSAGTPAVRAVSSASYTLSLGFWQPWGESVGCCVGLVGDVNNTGGDAPTIGDVSLLIDALFITVNSELVYCFAEADINQSGGADPEWSDVTIGDLSLLIDALFISVDMSMIPDCM